MTTASLPVLAGIASTVIFASSTLPMLVKARRTGDLTSYSRGNLLLANVGNAVHSVYVLALPAGPIWALHAFYVVSSGLMLLWYERSVRSAHKVHTDVTRSNLTATSTRLPGSRSLTPPEDAMSIPTLATLDTLLARLASDNAAAALRTEAERRLAWRYEESEYLLMSSLVEVPVQAGTSVRVG